MNWLLAYAPELIGTLAALIAGIFWGRSQSSKRKAKELEGRLNQELSDMKKVKDAHDEISQRSPASVAQYLIDRWLRK